MKAVLTYHSIDSTESAISVSEASFRGHVAWLTSGAVRVVPLENLVDAPEDEDAVAVTFDDGFANFGSIAAPLLCDAGLPCTVFVVPDRVGVDNNWGDQAQEGIPTLPLLDWDELASLSEAGISLGAHTITHPHLPRIPLREAEEEITTSASQIAERTGTPPVAFAYPYGEHDDAVVDVVARHFDVAVTADFSLLPTKPDPYRIPRLDMVYYRNATRLAAWGTGAFHRYLRLRQAVRWAGVRLRG